MTNQIRKQVEHYLSESFDFDKDINRPHKVTLTEGQLSTILYILEGYNPLDSNGYDPEFREDVDKIFEELEGVVDTYYGKNED